MAVSVYTADGRKKEGVPVSSGGSSDLPALSDGLGWMQVGGALVAIDLATQAELAAVDSALTTHKSSSDHDGRYYTEAEVNAQITAHQNDTTNVHGFSNIAQVPAMNSETGMRMIRGWIGGSGTSIVEGSGFSLSKQGNGDYDVIANPGFSDRPVIVAIGENNTTGGLTITTLDITNSQWTFRIRNGSGSLVDTSLMFIAIGPA